MSRALRGLASAKASYLVIGVLAAAVRLALVFRAPAFIIGDSENYFLPGYQLAREIGFDLDLRRVPGYPLFIALVVDWVAEDLSALVLVQHALGVGTCVAAAWVARRSFGALAGWVAGLAAALSAPLLVAEQYVMAEALFVPALMAVVVVAVWALERPSGGRMAIVGGAIGLACLIRPVGLAAAVALGLVIVLDQRRLAPIVRLGVCAVAGLLVVMLPWMARNAIVHGAFSTDGNPGQTLVGRTMRHDTGFEFIDAADPDPARRRAREIMQAGRGGFVSPVRERIKRELGLDDLAANRLMRDLAVDALRRQPDHYVIGTLANLGRLAVGRPERAATHWATRREARNREEWESHIEIRHLLGPPSPIQERQYHEAELITSLFQPATLGPTVALLALLGVLFAVRTPRRSTAMLLGLTAFGLLFGAVAMVAPLARYRYPAEPILYILAAGGLAGALQAANAVIGRRR